MPSNRPSHEITLTNEESAVLRAAFSHIVVRARTGELGILHGLDRFVSTHQSLTKVQRQHLDAALRKLGLSGLTVTSK